MGFFARPIQLKRVLYLALNVYYFLHWTPYIMFDFLLETKYFHTIVQFIIKNNLVDVASAMLS